MTRIDPDGTPEAAIAQALLSAPAWARIGITAPSDYIREEAAREIARAILEGAAGDTNTGNDQMTFGL